MKKTNKKNKEYPGLTQQGDIKIRHELYNDIDYINKLSPEEKLLAFQL